MLTSSIFQRVTYICDIVAFAGTTVGALVILSHVNVGFREAVSSYCIATWEFIASQIGATENAAAACAAVGASVAAAAAAGPLGSAIQPSAAALVANESRAFFHLHVLRASRFLWTVEALVRQGRVRGFAGTLPPRHAPRWRGDVQLSAELVVRVKNVDGTTRNAREACVLRPPLHAAVAAGNVALVKLLMAHATRDLLIDVDTPLLVLAASYNRLSLIDFLVTSLYQLVGDFNASALGAFRVPPNPPPADSSGIVVPARAAWMLQIREPGEFDELKRLCAQPEKVLSRALRACCATNNAEVARELLRAMRAQLGGGEAGAALVRKVLVVREVASTDILFEAVAAPAVLEALLRYASEHEPELLCQKMLCETEWKAGAVRPMTPLIAAVMTKNAQAVRLLLAFSQPKHVNQLDNGPVSSSYMEQPPMNALHHAVRNNFHGMVELLCDSGKCDVNQPFCGADAVTPLAYAVAKCFPLVVKRLLAEPAIELRQIPALIAKFGESAKHAGVLAVLQKKVADAPAAACC